MDIRDNIAAATLIIFSGYGLLFGAQRAVIYNKFQPIEASARKYLIEHSSETCGMAEIKPVVITDEWASIRAIPDMKTCITDPCWIIMKKSGNTWQGFTLGNCCFEGVPEELFKGEI